MKISILLDYKVMVILLVYLQRFKSGVKNIQKRRQGTFLFFFFHLIAVVDFGKMF